MIKFLILLILSINAFAKNDDCVDGPIHQLTTAVAATTNATCKQVHQNSVLDLATGCLSGGGKAAVGVVQGFGELLRLLLVDAPTYLWDSATSEIKKLLSSNLSPADMAASIANINMSSQSEIWNKARQYWESFKNFAADLKNELVSKVQDFPCLPLTKQSEIVCRGVSEVFLLVVSPAKFLQGAKWGINTAKAMHKFVQETNGIKGLTNMSLAKRLELATQELKDGKHVSHELMRINNSKLTEIELPDGEKILRYEQKIKGKDGKIHTVTREVPLDAKTKTIDANSAIGKEILTQAVNAKAGTGSLVFIDVNYLGKVNYFKDGTQGGDRYLASVAESLRKTLRPGDMIFKNGGDELVVVLATNNKSAVKEISQRMMNEVDKNPQIKQLFKHEVIAISKSYRELNTAKKLEDLPATITNTLSGEEKVKARANFANFKNEKLAGLKQQLMDQSTYRGSISVGASIVKPDETIANVLSRAEKQAALVKAQYKAKHGHDVSKYNIETGSVGGARNGPPTALDPN